MSFVNFGRIQKKKIQKGGEVSNNPHKYLHTSKKTNL